MGVLGDERNPARGWTQGYSFVITTGVRLRPVMRGGTSWKDERPPFCRMDTEQAGSPLQFIRVGIGFQNARESYGWLGNN